MPAEKREEEKFYSNREIYEMMMSEKDARLQLREELKLTREHLKQYNGLKDKIRNHGDRLGAIEEVISKSEGYKKGKFAVGQAVIKWTGWVVALITIGALLAQFLQS